VQRGLHAEGTVVEQDAWKPRVRYPIIEFTTERGEKVPASGAERELQRGQRWMSFMIPASRRMR